MQGYLQSIHGPEYPKTAPAVTALTLKGGNGTITGTFKGVAAEFLPLVQYYRVIADTTVPMSPTYGNIVDIAPVATGNAIMSFSIPGLTNGQQYYVRVYVRCVEGWQSSVDAVATATPRAGIELGTMSLMTLIKLNESGVGQDFYLVRHNAYGTTRTQLLRRYIRSERQWHTSNVSAYASCTLDAWFNNEYWGTLPADIRGQIAAVGIPYTLGNGNNTLSRLSRKVFAVSATELGQTHTYLNAEGTALANAATLKIATDSGGNAKVQWTRSPSANSNTVYAWHLGTDGNLNGDYCTYTHGTRPTFTLPANFLLNPTPNPDGSYSPAA